MLMLSFAVFVFYIVFCSFVLFWIGIIRLDSMYMTNSRKTMDERRFVTPGQLARSLLGIENIVFINKVAYPINLTFCNLTLSSISR